MSQCGIDTDRAKDLAFMQDPGEWPLWPVLPLSRPGDCCRELGFMVAVEDRLTIVYRGFIPAYRNDVATLADLDKFHEGSEKLTYADYGAILDDNWQVD